jgi:hypothetical protein
VKEKGKGEEEKEEKEEKEETVSIRFANEQDRRKRRTPSQAMIKKSSSGRIVVSVVYGAPTTNCFIWLSPSERVTAR